MSFTCHHQCCHPLLSRMFVFYTDCFRLLLKVPHCLSFGFEISVALANSFLFLVLASSSHLIITSFGKQVPVWRSPVLIWRTAK